jgi:hypothetical protein
VPTYRYLGVELDEQFNFSKQTASAVLKAKKGIGMLSQQLRKWAPMEVLSEAISKIALPALFYAIEVWYPPGEVHQKLIEKVNKFALRLLTNNFDSNTTYKYLLDKLKWKPLYRLVYERRLLCIKKYMDGSRFMFEEVFSPAPVKTSRSSTRLLLKINSHSLMLKTEEGQKNSREAKLSAAIMRKLWNLLDDKTVKAKFTVFKKEVTNDLFYKFIIEEGIIQCHDDV